MLGAICAAHAPAVRAARVSADLSDFEVYNFAILPGQPDIPDFRVGDAGGEGPNRSLRGLVKFSTFGMFGKTLRTARLHLYVTRSQRDTLAGSGVTTLAPPLVNPGLGDVVVVQVAEYFEPSVAAYDSPSLGNDPGTLIAAGVEPATHEVSIDIRAAMQQTIDEVRYNVVLRVQTAVENDGDALDDLWYFAQQDNADPVKQPFVEFTFAGSLAADFDEDGAVDADDLARWNAGYGASGAATLGQGDADGDGDVDGADFLTWQRDMGVGAITAPEPMTAGLAAAAVIAVVNIRRQASRQRM